MGPETQAIHPAAEKDLWKSWSTYLIRWLIFGGIVGGLQPVYDNPDQFWEQKLMQMLGGLLFGFACAIVFTLSQNTLNVQRARWKSWVILLTTWMGMKLVFVGVILLFGAAPF